MADELINLVEWAKGLEDMTASGMIEIFASTSDVLATIPFKTAPQGKNAFNRAAKQPNVAFRAINAEPEISHGGHEEFTDQCYPISGLLEHDRILSKRYGDRKKVIDMESQMEVASRLWTSTFIGGDNSTDPMEWSGMQKRLTDNGTASVDGTNDESRLIANSTASGGAALSMTMLDRAIDNVNKPNAILMERKMKNRLIQWSRDSSKSGYITHDKNAQGIPITRYGDYPILTGYGPARDNAFLPYTEVAYGGGSASTSSIYVVSFREDGVCGIQTSPPEYHALGHTDRGIFLRDLFEWDNGITMEDPYSAIRLSSIQDAPIAA